MLIYDAEIAMRRDRFFEQNTKAHLAEEVARFVAERGDLGEDTAAADDLLRDQRHVLFEWSHFAVIAFAIP